MTDLGLRSKRLSGFMSSDLLSHPEAHQEILSVKYPILREMSRFRLQYLLMSLLKRRKTHLKSTSTAGFRGGST